LPSSAALPPPQPQPQPQVQASDKSKIDRLPGGLKMEAEKKVYTLSEVSQHNNPKDCWLIIHGKVYDVTKFLEEHPGGDEILLTATGKDATDDFEDIGHSTSAKASMDVYCVGEVDMSTIPNKVKYVALKNHDDNNDVNASDFTIRILQFLVPLAILGLAFGIRLVYS
ncbi:hypothetical protein V2J09_024094, partial [Rumex salicifolius]